MHETGIAAEIYGVARQTADTNGGGRLLSVKVEVGELSAIEPDLLAFAWEAVTSGGPDAAARLDVEWRPARQICASCGEIGERAPGTWLRLCPRCEGTLRIEGGDELDVRDVTFEDARDAEAGR
jgi:hydrogenase nickel incorporation protein HypA/HybF